MWGSCCSPTFHNLDNLDNHTLLVRNRILVGFSKDPLQRSACPRLGVGRGCPVAGAALPWCCPPASRAYPPGWAWDRPKVNWVKSWEKHQVSKLIPLGWPSWLLVHYCGISLLGKFIVNLSAIICNYSGVSTNLSQGLGTTWYTNKTA